MTAKKDFYKVLDVSEQSSAEEIKKAYRKLAKKYHPDATGGDKSKEAKFKEITEAYDTLGDQKKKKEYDAIRKNPFSANEGAGFGGFQSGPSGQRVPFDFSDLLGGVGSFESTDGFSSWSSPSRGGDLQTNMALAFAEAALGCEKNLVLEPQRNGGRRLTIRVPAGVEEGETIRVPGQGRAASRGGAPGDLLVQVHILPHNTLRRTGIDIETDLPIRVEEAILGTKTTIQSLDGPLQVTVPAGTSSGQKLRVRGKGAGNRKGGRGDLYAIVKILVPKKISAEAEALITQFAEKVSYE